MLNLKNTPMAMINIILNAILIPEYGILGAAIATGISITIINIIKVFEVKHLLGIIPYNKEYFLVFFNLLAICFSSLIIKIYWNNIVSIILVTILNMGISIAIAYHFKREIDEIVLNKIVTKAKTIFAK